MKTKLIPPILTLLLTACNGGASVQVPGGDLGTDTVVGDAASMDLISADSAEDMGVDAEPRADLTMDTEPLCEPETGCFSDPCNENEECLSGWCVDHMGDSVCTETCQEDCPVGWSCEQVSSGGRDVIFICVSEVPSLCLPCWTGSDCIGTGGLQPPCVILEGEGSFCGAPCAEDDVCPEGYSCAEVATVQGAVLPQCIPDSGVCACTPKAIEAGLTTPCAFENDAGICAGVRACTEAELGPCDAQEPAVETCNDFDDDCDGDVDEDTCDDGNPCTEDACQGTDGCDHMALDGVECPDGNLCTVSDVCTQGICVGEPKDCEDDNPCTDDWCDADTGLCEHEDNVADCDDGDPCTVADECNGGICAGTPVACDCVTDEDCGKLEDGDLCNGTLYCDTGSIPHLCKVDPDTTISCPPPAGPDAPCLDTACDPETGACGFAEANEGYPCEEGDPCTVGDICEKGECIPGVDTNCNDGNPCTDDSCMPGVGCQNTPNAAPCEDGDICTVGDQCVAGECEHGPQIACDDGNPCTDDTCDSTVGCVHTPNTAVCDDGNLCTEIGTCDGGVCQPGKAITCDDEDVCTDNTCAPAIGCVFTHNTALCDDGNPCTSPDVCSGGICGGGPVDCGDGNICTDDGCDPVTGCVHTPNTASCDDGNACTVADACAGGACQPGAPVSCNDGNVCTDDGCDPVDGCDHTPNTVPCDDNNACTLADTCVDGQCGGGGAVGCDDANPCTSDSCDWQTGCVNQSNMEPCDDLNACTTGDICGAGVCNPGAAVDCDDGNICTTDSCAPLTGCVNTVNSAPCDDGNACTTGDHCEDGECTPLSTQGCDDGNVCTDDSCDPVTGCQHVDNTLPCDDGNTCTTGDICADGSCAGSGSLDCDDLNPCTKDMCLPGGGCAYENIAGACDDGDPCTVNDACVGGVCISGPPADCDDGNPCTDDSCDDTGTCQNAANSASCDDGNACTTGDHCAGGACVPSGGLPCDDGNVCTTDSCDPWAGCVYVNNTLLCNDGDACTIGEACAGGVCTGGSTMSCDDGNLCTTDSCDPDVGCAYDNNTVPCDDGNACTMNDACFGGACQPGAALSCDDGNVCTTDSCVPASGCVNTNNTVPCNDGDPCTTVDACAGGTCVGSGTLTCNDGNHCTSDTCQAFVGCVYTPITPCCGNTVVEAGEQCDDGNTNNGDGCSSTCQIESTCGGWQWNGACWYTGSLGQSCNSVCASHCGFDVQGSKHTGNTVGFHFWPGKNNGSNWVSVECSSTDNNTNWGANGSTPSGTFTHSACHLNCGCNC